MHLGTANDFNQDGRSEPAVYQAARGRWLMVDAVHGTSTQFFGYARTLPLTGLFDGDTATDMGCYDPVRGDWYVLHASGSMTARTLSVRGGIPFAADVDGDGLSDLVHYLPRSGVWTVFTGTGTTSSWQFGFPGAIPLVADFDGDGLSDVAVFAPNNAVWYLHQSASGFMVQQFGFPGAHPVVGDFDGDGRDDMGVYDAASGRWFLRQSTDGLKIVRLGGPFARPVVGDFDGDERCDPGLYFPATGAWRISGSSSTDPLTYRTGRTGGTPLGRTDQAAHRGNGFKYRNQRFDMTVSIEGLPPIVQTSGGGYSDLYYEGEKSGIPGSSIIVGTVAETDRNAISLLLQSAQTADARTLNIRTETTFRSSTKLWPSGFDGGTGLVVYSDTQFTVPNPYSSVVHFSQEVFHNGHRLEPEIIMPLPGGLSRLSFVSVTNGIPFTVSTLVTATSDTQDQALSIDSILTRCDVYPLP